MDTIECVGTVVKIHGNNNYMVEVGAEDAGKREILCYIGGKMKKYRINILVGDEVTVEVPPPYDKGRITYRGKKEDRVRPSGPQKRTKERKRAKGRGAR